MMLHVSDLHVAIPVRRKTSLFGGVDYVEILKGVDLDVGAGECVGVVGESGSGKSTLARAVIRLLRPRAGRVMFEGRDIAQLSQREMQPLRQRMQMVFQDSQSSLNPRLTIGAILAEPFLVFGKEKTRRGAAKRAAALIEEVGLPATFLQRYAHQLSGGQRQRIGLARAIALRPSLVIADEIVSGLDVSVQAQILALLKDLRQRTGMAVVLISHDLSVVRAVCQTVVVLRHGSVMEKGSTDTIFADPKHPYTQRLIRAIPLPDVDRTWINDLHDEEPTSGEQA